MDVRFSEKRWDAFGGSPSESSAYKFGTQGVAIWARKPGGGAADLAADDAAGERGRADAMLEAAGESCATLTPLIRARMQGMESGQVLEVRTDDPAAREGVPAWSRLTGNALVETEESDSALRFFLRKK